MNTDLKTKTGALQRDTMKKIKNSGMEKNLMALYLSTVSKD